MNKHPDLRRDKRLWALLFLAAIIILVVGTVSCKAVKEPLAAHCHAHPPARRHALLPIFTTTSSSYGYLPPPAGWSPIAPNS
jgi:hypothetical protein